MLGSRIMRESIVLKGIKRYADILSKHGAKLETKQKIDLLGQDDNIRILHTAKTNKKAA